MCCLIQKSLLKESFSKEVDKTLLKGFKLLGLTAYQVMSDKNMLNRAIQEFQRFY